MRLKLTSAAESDLDTIAAYIAKDSMRHAERTLQRFYAEFDAIAGRPLLYRLRPEVADDLRISLIDDYLILFRIENDLIRVYRIVHGSRNLPALGL